MDHALLLHVDGKRSLFENKRVVPLLDYPKIESPVYVLSDFDGAISGVSVVNNKSRYAEALISRRLRDEGLIDGEVRILVHHNAQTDDGYQILYTAISKNVWQNMQSWSWAQREHCLLIPKTALMYSLLSGENEGVILRSGRNFSLLARQQKTMHTFSVLALSDAEEDLRIAARALAERAKEHQPEGTGRLLKWCWYTLGAVSHAEEEVLARIFKETSGAEVSMAATEAYTKKSGEQIFASLEILRPHLSEKLAANPFAGKISYFAEKKLTLISCVIGVMALGLFGWGMVSLLQAKAMAAQEKQNILEAQKIAQNLQGKATTIRQDKQVNATRDFVGLVVKAQESVDPHSFLQNLRVVAGDSVRIMRVQIQPEDKSIVIEGWIEQTGGSDKPLADFVEQLRGLGFSPKAIDSISGANARRNGSFAYRLLPVSDDERTGL